MGFFKKVLKTFTPLEYLPEKVQSIAYPAIGSLIGGPSGAAFASGLNTYNDTGSFKNAGLSAAGSYAGSSIGGALGDKFGLGNVGGAIDTIGGGSAIANFAGNTLPAEITNASIGSIIGQQYGTDMAANSFDTPASSTGSGQSPFSPTQEDQKDAPASLLGLGSLTSEQQSTNLANQGVYGGGLGSEENSYFLNQVNRRLVDQSGNTSDYKSTLKPIEMSYLEKLGLGGYNDSSSLLEAISKWSNA